MKKLMFALLASLALAVGLLPAPSASARQAVALAPHWVVFGYPPGGGDEQIYGRYHHRWQAENAADDAASPDYSPGGEWEGLWASLTCCPASSYDPHRGHR